MSVAEEGTAMPHRLPPVRKPRSAGDARALFARAVTSLRKISAAESRREARIAYYQQKIEDIKQKTLKERDDQTALIRRIMPRLYDFLEDNWFELTNRGKRKSIAFPDGLFRKQAFRYTEIPNEEDYFREVKGLNLGDLFIRTKEEPNRSALLDESNKDKLAKLATARVVEESRPQLTSPGLSFRIERVRSEQEDEWEWDVIDTRNRDR